MDLSLFRFEHDPAAEKLFGKINCAYLDQLLIRGEPIVKADRTGIDWTHDFAKALKRAVEAELGPIVEEERERAKELRRVALSEELKEKISSALPELNKLAQAELGKLTPGDETEQKAPFVPESGFGFVPQYAQIVVGKQGMLVLRAHKNGPYKLGTIVQVASENEMVLVHTEQVVLEQDSRHENILSSRVVLEGRQVGAESIITATLGDLEAEALVKVISKRELADEPSPQKKPGLFQDVRFDEHADPRHRARFDNGTIVVAVSAPSVSPYIGPGGRGTENAQGQVMLAELVVESVCKEIARQGILKGKFISAPGAEADAVQR